MIDFEALLGALTREEVEFIIVGGVAATAHGAARLTQDLDVVYARADENLARMERALTPHHPYLRGAPEGLPFVWDVATIRRGLNFTLTTDLGDVDFLGEITGGGLYEDLVGDAVTIEIFESQCLVLGLRKLIEVKRAEGRPKDFEAVAELEHLLEETED